MGDGPAYKDRECSGDTLVPGAARGHRAWFMGTDGFLRGITYRQVWRPGENVATCLVARRGTNHAMPRVTNLDVPFRTAGVGFASGLEGTEPLLLDDFDWNRCDGLASDCACGFYAYHRQSVPGYGFLAHNGDWGTRVGGVIEGYGKVVLGSTGFRAEKARILAVTMPHPSTYHQSVDSRTSALKALEEEAERLLAEPLTGICRGAVIGLFMSAAFVGVTPVIGWWGALGSVASGYIAWGSEQYSRRLDREGREELTRLIEGIRAELGKCPPSYAEVRGRFLENYPDVPLYTEMQALRVDWPVEDLTYLLEGGES